jgi:uncharacterized protein (DUF885 family)
MDQPIHAAAVTKGIEDALRIAERCDEGALLNASRECHRALRQEPSVLKLDRCVAFDDAVVKGGNVPMDVLAKNVDDYVARTKSA